MLRRLSAVLALVSASLVSPAFAGPNKDTPAPKFDKESHTVELVGAKSYKKGVEGTVEIVLNAKSGYHVNPDYPAKFKATDPAPEGITYPKKVLEKKDGDFKETKASLKVPFVAANAGKAKVSGVFAYSVCSDKNCFMEKAPLELEVTVTN